LFILSVCNTTHKDPIIKPLARFTASNAQIVCHPGIRETPALNLGIGQYAWGIGNEDGALLNFFCMAKFNEVINSGKTVLVDFSAEWCGPCKMMSPILKELASMTSDQVKILKVDVDKNQEAAMTYQVQSVPTLIIFKNGQVKWRQSGVVPAQQLKSILEQVSAASN